MIKKIFSAGRVARMDYLKRSAFDRDFVFRIYRTPEKFISYIMASIVFSKSYVLILHVSEFI